MVVGRAESGRGGRFWNVLYIGFAETARIENKFGTVYGYMGGPIARKISIYSAAAVYSSWKVGASGGVCGVGYLFGVRAVGLGLILRSMDFPRTERRVATEAV